MLTLVVIAAAVLAAVAVVLSALVLRAVSRTGTAADPRPQLEAVSQRLDQVVDRVRGDAAEQATSLRADLRASEQETRREATAGRQELLGMLGTAHEQVVTALAAQQQSAERLAREGLTAQATSATTLQEAQVAATGALRQTLETATTSLQERQAAGLDRLREELTTAVAALAESTSTAQRESAAATSAAQKSALADLRDTVAQRLAAVTEGQEALRTHLTKGADTARTEQAVHLKALRDDVVTAQTAMRTEVSDAVKQLSSTSQTQLEAVRTAVARSLKDLGSGQAEQLRTLTSSMTVAQKSATAAMTTSLDAMTQKNETSLETMRATVQEKLDATLGQRLDSSFKVVSERLENVQRGLGEMQDLAKGVGSLQRTLTHVHTRGAWAELQLEALLGDLLTSDQFVRQYRINPESADLVDFALRLPGTKEGVPVWLGIDSKFPMDAYERFQAAWQAGDTAAVKLSSKQLVDRVVAEARSISGKYVNPPHTTDFAVMYLPTEGLFAEVVRQPGLVHDLRTKHKVVVAGPTTLTALLSSMSMGFRTLAIERRSSEVWEVLGSVKAEFEKSAVVWEKLEKQLQTAGRTAHESGTRHRAIERRLRSVESMPLEASVPRQVGSMDAEPLAALVGIDEFEVAD